MNSNPQSVVHSNRAGTQGSRLPTTLEKQLGLHGHRDTTANRSVAPALGPRLREGIIRKTDEIQIKYIIQLRVCTSVNFFVLTDIPW